MDYDTWKLETPDEEDERLSGRMRRERERAEWMADHEDYLREDMDRAILRAAGFDDEA